MKAYYPKSKQEKVEKQVIAIEPVKIPVDGGYVALVNKIDAPKVLTYSWRMVSGVPTTNMRIGNHTKLISMANIVLDVFGEIMYSDGDTLNNRRSNIRIKEILKVCNTCGGLKPLDEFRKRKGAPDGRLSQCKLCRNRLDREKKLSEKMEKYSERLERIQDYIDNEQKLVDELADIIAERRKLSKAATKEKRRTYNRKYNSDHASDQKQNARVLLNLAKRWGFVDSPTTCADCGAESPLEAHHHDYSKPFDVEWLCKTCHGKRHRRNKEIPNFERAA